MRDIYYLSTRQGPESPCPTSLREPAAENLEVALLVWLSLFISVRVPNTHSLYCIWDSHREGHTRAEIFTFPPELAATWKLGDENTPLMFQFSSLQFLLGGALQLTVQYIFSNELNNKSL